MNLKGYAEAKKKGQIIWVHGYPCSGKTFTADYLATVGWYNVDGDWIFSATDPDDLAFGKKLGEAFKKVVAEKPLSDEEKGDFDKYLKGLCDQAIKSADEGVDTAISFVMYKKWMRDYIKTFIPDIKIIHVKVDVAILLPKNVKRMTKAMALHNMTLE